MVEQADVVGHRARGVDVVGDDQERRVDLGVEVDDQLVEERRTDRVEAGVGLVEEHDLGVEHQRAGQAGPLAHAAGDLAGQLVLGADRGRPGPSSPSRWRGSRTRTSWCARAAGRRRCRRGSSSRTSRRPGTARRRACGSRRARFSGQVAMSVPSMTTEPRSGLSRPIRVLSSTDLPVPDGPSITQISPAGTVRVTSPQMSCLPKDLVSPSILISTPMAPPFASTCPGS